MGIISDASPLDPMTDGRRVFGTRVCEMIAEMVRLGSPNVDPSPFSEFAADKLWIADEDGNIIRFNLNEVQRRYMASIREMQREQKASRVLILKSRRIGFSTLEQGRSYRIVRSRRNTRVMTLAHTDDRTKDIFDIPRLMHEKDTSAPVSKRRGNQYKIEFPTLNSRFTIATAGARGVGRGATLHRVHCSEVAFWALGPKQYEKQEAIMAGLLAAARKGEVVCETTANGSEWFKATYQEARKGQNEWSAFFYPWFVDARNAKPLNDQGVIEIRETYTDDETQLMERAEREHSVRVTPEMIAWRRDAKVTFKRLFPQEYPEDDETCFAVSGGTCWFNLEIIRKLMAATPDYTREHLRGGYSVKWLDPKPGRKYVLGADTSEGLDTSDFNGFGILDKESGEQVAAVHGRFTIRRQAELIVRWAQLYNEALCGIERENHGHAVITKVQDLGYRRRRLLYHAPTPQRGAQHPGRQGKRPGWSTNAQSRPIMLSELADAIEAKSMTVHDRDLLGECVTFKKQGDGKYAADSGEFDDCVFKWAIAWQMRKVRAGGLGVSAGRG